MSRNVKFAVFVCAVIVPAVGVPAAAAAPLSLSLPQSAALSVLGASCGGIQEQSYATGFDAAGGYPSGAVYLSTRCGGSGRGGGYHTTTYSAWAAVTWDFTAAVISYSRLAGAPTVDPAFSAVDGRGDRIYNQSGSAYLVLAPGAVPAARIAALSVSTGPAAGGTAVTINGTGFSGVTAVSFGTAAAKSFVVNSPTSITATSPAASAGVVDVTVTNAGGASAASSGDQFTFVAAPSLSSVAPSSGPLYGGTTVTLTGAHLTAVTAVSFGGTPASFDVDSDTSITAVAPAGEAAGAVSVSVTSIGGRSARTVATRFTYVVVPPAVTSIDPSIGPEAGGSFVTIAGTDFTGATEVDFGGVPAAFSVDSNTSITAIAPPGAGTVDVTVSTPGGTSPATAADVFTYVAEPSVSAVSPSAGPVEGGILVTITGVNFGTATEVDFGGVPADFTVDSDTSLTAVAPPGAAGAVDVTVTTTGGTSAFTVDDQFTYTE